LALKRLSDAQRFVERVETYLKSAGILRNVVTELPDLTVNERLALTQLLDSLQHEHSHTVLQVVLYGSSARGGRGSDSDVDLLIISRHDDWRDHEPIRFLAARLSNEYDVFLSVRVMGLARFQRLRSLQPLLYQNICQDGLELLRLDSGPGLVEQQPLPA
jgi:predicted nucleotidyltransferase